MPDNGEPIQQRGGDIDEEQAMQTATTANPAQGELPDGKKCVRASQLIYPLGGEDEGDLHYPQRVFHYSTCHSASNVFIVAEMQQHQPQQPTEGAKLYVWSLYTGSRRVMTPVAEDKQLRHFYASAGARGVNSGVAIFVGSDQKTLSLHAVRLDNTRRELTLLEQLCKHTPIGHLHTWSSSRYENSGVVLIVRDSVELCVYICALPMPQEPFASSAAPTLYEYRFNNEYLGDFRFSTQPFIHDAQACFFEHQQGEFTGRLARIPLEDEDDDKRREISYVDVRPDGDFGSFQFPLDRLGQMPMRIKHVERHGTLWLLMETIVNEEELLLDRLAHRMEALPRVGVRMAKLQLDTLRWEEVVLAIDGHYDDLCLDVSSSGSVVLVRKREGSAFSSGRLDGFYLYRDTPDTLKSICLQALIRRCPQLRFEHNPMR